MVEALTPVERDVIEAAEAAARIIKGTVPAAEQRSASVWTAILGNELAQRGASRHGAAVFSRMGDLAIATEILVDMLWLSGTVDPSTGMPQTIIGVPLALECEWGRSFRHIEEDFVKLTLVHAQGPGKVGHGTGGARHA